MQTNPYSCRIHNVLEPPGLPLPAPAAAGALSLGPAGHGPAAPVAAAVGPAATSDQLEQLRRDFLEELRQLRQEMQALRDGLQPWTVVQRSGSASDCGGGGKGANSDSGHNGKGDSGHAGMQPSGNSKGNGKGNNAAGY